MLPTKELVSINTSGDLALINLGGTDPKNKVVTQEALDAHTIPLPPADQAKIDLIHGSTAINFDEIILDGDRATTSDIDDPNAVPATLERFISIAGLRHAFTQFGNVVRETYELVGNNPTMKMKVLDGGHAAQMQVMYKHRSVASMEWFQSTQSFLFSLSDKDTGTLKAQFEIKPDGHAYIGFKQVATLGDLDRPTVVSAYTNTPTKAELITAAKLTPHYTNDVAFWGADHDFYVRDDPQTKMLLVKYRGTAANTSESTAGNMFFEKLSKAN